MEDNNSTPSEQPPTGLASEQPLNPAPIANPAPVTAPQPNTQTETWKTILTVIFLFLSPLIGIILTWALTNWSKKVKIIITVAGGALFIISIAGILVATVFVGMGSAREKARDVQVKSNLRSVGNGLEMYYENNSKLDAEGRLIGGYPVNDSFRAMYSELTSTKIFTSPLTDSGGYMYKYCSTDGSAFILQVNQTSSPQPFELDSTDGAKDTCTPGE